MSNLNPGKLNVRWMEMKDKQSPLFPRSYTLTHSDRTGDLYLTIGSEIDREQISGWYTRLMRDEVLANWEVNDGDWSLLVHVHVSGGVVVGSAGWRNSIFRHHLHGVLQAFRYGDPIFNQLPKLDRSPVHVYFHAKHPKYNKVEQWGVIGDYRMNSLE